MSLSELAYETLDELHDEEFEAIVWGVDDTLRVELVLQAYPFTALTVRPAPLYVDGKWVDHEVQSQGEADVEISEGDAYHIKNATLERYEVLDQGPGPDIMEVELEER